ncbi:MAG: DUF2029 domain-containing protein [Geminicoccaceae bacterium]|nr:DUF2029 domain-containing protein [Geminicoccaceae bacterium]
MLLVSALLMAAQVILGSLQPSQRSDFFVFWSAARYVAERPAHDVTGIYDPATFKAFQRTLVLGEGDAPNPDPPAAVEPSFHPFAYPPHMLLLLRPLAALDEHRAELAWLLAGFALLVAAVGAHRRPARLVALAVAPAALIDVAYGQNGFWTAALLAGGLLRLADRPVLAGVAFGLLTIKPQLGLVVPVVLLGAGAWRALAAATLTTLALVSVTALLFGVEAWRAWFVQLHGFADTTILNLQHLSPHLASLPAALLQSGLSIDAARIVHLVVAVAVLAGLWTFARSRRRASFIDSSKAGRLYPRGNDRAMAPNETLTVAALLATPVVAPFAYVYDTMLIVPAILLLASVGAHRRRAEGRIVLLGLWLAPFLSIGLMPLGIPAVPLACAAALIVFFVPMRECRGALASALRIETPCQGRRDQQHGGGRQRRQEEAAGHVGEDAGGDRPQDLSGAEGGGDQRHHLRRRSGPQGPGGGETERGDGDEGAAQQQTTQSEPDDRRRRHAGGHTRGLD